MLLCQKDSKPHPHIRNNNIKQGGDITMRQLLQQDHHAWLLSQFLFLREVPVETLYLSYVIHVRVIMRSYCLSSCSCGRLPQGLLYSFMQPLTRFSKRSYCLSSCSCGSSHRDFVLVICNPRQDYHAWLLFQFLFLREVPVGTQHVQPPN